MFEGLLCLAYGWTNVKKKKKKKNRNFKVKKEEGGC